MGEWFLIGPVAGNGELWQPLTSKTWYPRALPGNKRAFEPWAEEYRKISFFEGEISRIDKQVS
jgi:hypothetical protein